MVTLKTLIFYGGVFVLYQGNKMERTLITVTMVLVLCLIARVLQEMNK